MSKEFLISAVAWQMFKQAFEHALERAEESGEDVRPHFGGVVKMIQTIDESCEAPSAFQTVVNR